MRGRFGAPLSLFALAALAISLYLAWTKLAGEVPVCGPLRGCEDVNASEYSTVAGVPVALLGAAGSLATLLAGVVWWRTADRRALLVAYGLGLVSLPFLAWLTYLEVAVIHAICVWCVTYALCVIGGWLSATAALVTMRRDEG